MDELLRVLIGQYLHGSHRAADLESFQIGRPRVSVDSSEPLAVSEYAIHVQSPWRITKGGRIVIGYADLREPEAGIADLSFDPNELGSTRREALLSALFRDHAGRLAVESVSVKGIGDLRLRFSSGHSLEVFPDSSDNEDDPEYWRLVKLGDWHAVVSGHGIMFIE